MAPEYLHHDPATPGGIAYGRDGLRQLITSYRTAFPDLHFTIDGQLAENHTVVTCWTATGTMHSHFHGLPPTGSPVTITGITLTRFSDTLILEDRLHWDNLGTLVPCGLDANLSRRPKR